MHHVNRNNHGPVGHNLVGVPFYGDGCWLE